MFEDTKGINVALIFNNNFNKKKRYIGENEQPAAGHCIMYIKYISRLALKISGNFIS
jgi:hypothetical protein